MTRQLKDRIETYTKLMSGQCSCGQDVIKVLGSNCTMWKNGDRYHYPNDNSATCIFRCKNCNEPIHETWTFV